MVWRLGGLGGRTGILGFGDKEVGGIGGGLVCSSAMYPVLDLLVFQAGYRLKHCVDMYMYIV